jgi:hypothetical protein
VITGGRGDWLRVEEIAATASPRSDQAMDEFRFIEETASTSERGETATEPKRDIDFGTPQGEEPPSEGMSRDPIDEIEVRLWFNDAEGVQINYAAFTLTNTQVTGMRYTQLHNLQSNAAEMATEAMVEFGLAFEEIEVEYDDGSGPVTAEDGWLKPVVGDDDPGEGGSKSSADHEESICTDSIDDGWWGGDADPSCPRAENGVGSRAWCVGRRAYSARRARSPSTAITSSRGFSAGSKITCTSGVSAKRGVTLSR